MLTDEHQIVNRLRNTKIPVDQTGILFLLARKITGDKNVSCTIQTYLRFMVVSCISFVNRLMLIYPQVLEPAEGVEPTTCCLQNSCSDH